MELIAVIWLWTGPVLFGVIFLFYDSTTAYNTIMTQKALTLLLFYFPGAWHTKVVFSKSYHKFDIRHTNPWRILDLRHNMSRKTCFIQAPGIWEIPESAGI